jgi:hypothetical protein
MDLLLQFIGKGSDQQITTEAQRRSGTVKLMPSKPQLGCRSIEQAGDSGFDITRVRVSCAIVPVAASTGNGRRPARVLASRRIVDCRLHSLAGSAMR